MKRQLSYVLLLWLCLTGGCDWFKGKDNPSPEEQLPPETQIGANTFGCLVNGKPWTPKGFKGPLVGPNFDVVYDPSHEGGNLDIQTYRVEDGEDSYITIFAFGISNQGVYSLDLPASSPRRGAYYAQFCDYNDDDEIYRKGSLTITKLDMQQRIVSGRFEFVLAKQGCDTIKVTQGRFDKKL
jgi:hypothetical protein